MKLKFSNVQRTKALVYLLFFESINFYMNTLIQEGVGIKFSTSSFFFGIAILFAIYTYINVFFFGKNYLSFVAIAVFSFGTIMYCLKYPDQISLIYTSLFDFAYNPMLRLFLFCLPVLILCLEGIDLFCFINESVKMCRICLVICTFSYFVYSIGQNYSGSLYMSFSYNILPSECILIIMLDKSEKKLFDLVLILLGSIIICIAGSRGALVCYLFFLVILMMFSPKINNTKRIVIAFLLVGAIVFFVVYWNQIIIAISNILSSYGIYSRNINRLIDMSFMQVSIRDSLNKTMLQAALKSPLFGYGMWGDRPIVNGFSHNIFYELIVSYGFIFGGILFLLVIFLPVLALVKKVKHDGYKDVLVAAIPYGLVSLFFSGTYLNHVWFFFFVGLMYFIKVNNNKVCIMKSN